MPMTASDDEYSREFHEGWKVKLAEKLRESVRQDREERAKQAQAEADGEADAGQGPAARDSQPLTDEPGR